MKIKKNVIKSLIKSFWGNCNLWKKWVILFILPPLILSYFLLKFPFGVKGLERDKVDKTSEPAVLESPVEELSKSIFSVSAELNWYYLCGKNNNKVFVNGVKIQPPFGNDPEAGAMEVDGLYLPVNTFRCNLFNIKQEKSTSTVVFRLPLPELVDPILEDVKNGEVTASKEAYIDPRGSFFIYFPYPLELITKFLIIFIGWIVFMTSLLTSFKLVKDLKKRKAIK